MWYKKDSPRSGRPSTSSIAKNTKRGTGSVLENRFIIIRDIAGKLDIYRETIRLILVDALSLRRIIILAAPIRILIALSWRHIMTGSATLTY